MKRCSCCKQLKPFSAYPRNRTTPTGWAYACTECAVARNRRYLMIETPRKSRPPYRRDMSADRAVGFDGA